MPLGLAIRFYGRNRVKEEMELYARANGSMGEHTHTKWRLIPTGFSPSSFRYLRALSARSCCFLLLLLPILILLLRQYIHHLYIQQVKIQKNTQERGRGKY